MRPTLIWLNGAHGAGKTSVARVLAERLDLPIVDPEQIGFMLRRITPWEVSADFKDSPLWRKLTLETLSAACVEASKSIIVPMTLFNRAHHDEIVGGVRARGADVHHFTLLASPGTLRRRLMGRLAWPASTRWSLDQVERCVAALERPEFAVHVRTDRRSIGEIAGEILSALD